MTDGKRLLISGASFAGLSSALGLARLGWQVTVVERAPGLRRGGTPVDIKGRTVATLERMGLLDRVRALALPPRWTEFKGAEDQTLIRLDPEPEETVEIERDALLDLLHDQVRDLANFRFVTSISALSEGPQGGRASFSDGSSGDFDLVLGCDGLHSAVRRLCFGPEAAFSRFLGRYFSITIAPRLLIAPDSTQIFNAPGIAAILSAYHGKTDIVLAFAADQEISHDPHDRAAQKAILLDRLAGSPWRIPALLEEVAAAPDFYFDKLAQIVMPSWVTGRVALVGDAGYCASPAAGMGGSLALEGAAALAEAFARHDDPDLALADYDRSFRPWLEEVQAEARANVALFFPGSEEEIQRRNAFLQS
jgi:2-polyprenyl-6-methoxyphenol hydroxylase-like FAD-dependent oxidoreductase